MPVSSVTNRVSYQGDGTSAIFSFQYPLHKQADLAVFAFNSSISQMITPCVLNAAGGFGFTISGTANASGVYPNGVNVVMNSAPNIQTVIVVVRSSVITNTFQMGESGAIPASSLNNSVDYLTLLVQRAQDQVSRAAKLPDGYSGGFDPTLPPSMTMFACSVLMVNSSGNAFAVGPQADQIYGAQSAAISAAASAAAAGASATSAAAQVVLANSAAVSASDSAFQAASAAFSANTAVAVIGSTAFWGALAASSALSATNQAVLAGSASLSASNQAVLAGSGALSASNQAALAAAQVVLANSAAVSATNQAVLSGSAALSASNSASLIGTATASKTAAYNATTSDRFLFVSSSNYTINLYGTAGQAGKQLTIKKVDHNMAFGITIAGSNALIGDEPSTTINTWGEQLDLVCDGTSWLAKRVIPNHTGSSAPTTRGFGTVGTNFQYSHRVGDRLFCQGSFFCGSSTPSVGQVQMLYDGQPVTFDATKHQPAAIVGMCGIGANTPNPYFVLSPANNGSSVNISIGSASTGQLQGQNGNVLLTGQNIQVTYTFSIPITGWKGT